MNLPQQKSYQLNQQFFSFINEDVLPKTQIEQTKFWEDFVNLVKQFSPKNQELLSERNRLQTAINEWHLAHKENGFDQETYKKFLTDIGYIKQEGSDFKIETENVDDEIATIAGPQLVVPVNNARFALNAANARWGSLYDALYGTDVIAKEPGLLPGKKYNEARGNRVVAYAKNFLDDVFPLSEGSHHNVTSYLVYYQNLLAIFPDGSRSGLKDSSQFVALRGSREAPSSVLLKNNGLHVELQFSKSNAVGKTDFANIEDIRIESALTTIMDFEDSVAAVDANDKIEVYKNWLGLIEGSLTSSFVKDGQRLSRKLAKDKLFTAKDDTDYKLSGRSLMLARNVGHLMDSDLLIDEQGYGAPEGIIDTVVTALIGSIDLHSKSKYKNSKTGSIYIVKPKMHGPEEVQFCCDVFTAVEEMLGLERFTLKLGVMDEERRTTLNLKECIRAAKKRIVFINTGFLDRTGDEIHTSMEAGAFLPKAEIKLQPWIDAYEKQNVEIGLACGFKGKAQIGKGMWPMPDEMQMMMNEKITHPASGANTAWVPSPTAATLHALHYHKINVADIQSEVDKVTESRMDDLLRIPLIEKERVLSKEEIDQELRNNIQGILGYVVRWVDLGIGCSKVPDINDTGLMEDRATLRISSQHIANWLHHGICQEQQVKTLLSKMARVVDKQNFQTDGYQSMSDNTDNSLSFKAASELIFKGCKQPSGYTEPVLHNYRQLVKTKTSI